MAAKKLILYKVLKQDGTPKYQTSRTAFWPMPKNDTPGDWVDIGTDRVLRICGWGLHGYRTMEKAQADCGPGQLVYEMEVDVSLPFLDERRADQKMCCQRARILKAVADRQGPLVFLADYVWQ